MPIYAYRCDACGHTKDALQKVSDPLLTRCPACGAEAFKKQVTAAGFQLKGSGWYVTDFKGDNSKKAAAADKGEAAKSDAAAGEASKGDAAKGESKAPESSAGKAGETASPAPAPAIDKSAKKAPAAAPSSGAGSGGAAPGK